MLWSDSSAKMGLGFEEMEAAGTFQMCYSRYRRLSLSLWRETEGDYRSFDLLWRCPGSHKCNTVLYSPLTSENAFMAGDADPELPGAVNGFLPSWEKTLWMSSFFFLFLFQSHLWHLSRPGQTSARTSTGSKRSHVTDVSPFFTWMFQ